MRGFILNVDRRSSLVDFHLIPYNSWSWIMMMYGSFIPDAEKIVARSLFAAERGFDLLYMLDRISEREGLLSISTLRVVEARLLDHRSVHKTSAVLRREEAIDKVKLPWLTRLYLKIFGTRKCLSSWSGICREVQRRLDVAEQREKEPRDASISVNEHFPTGFYHLPFGDSALDRDRAEAVQIFAALV